MSDAASDHAPAVMKSVADTERMVPELALSSPDRLIAVMLQPASSQPDLGAYHVHLPATSDDRLCIRIATADGVYVARPVYDLTGVSPGVHVLDFDSAHRRLLRDYREQELVIAAWAAQGACGASPSGAMFPAGWGVNAGATRLIVFVNSADSYGRVRMQDDAAATPPVAACRRIETIKPRRVFDKLCLITDNYKHTEIRAWVDLFDFGKQVDSVPVHLRSALTSLVK